MSKLVLDFSLNVAQRPSRMRWLTSLAAHLQGFSRKEGEDKVALEFKQMSHPSSGFQAL